MQQSFDVNYLCRFFLSLGRDWKNKNEKDMTNEEHTHYKYVPYYGRNFAYIANDIVKDESYATKKFMDVGCGYPAVPLIMKILGLKNSVGLEYDKKYVNIFNKMELGYDMYHNCLIYGDMLEYDFSQYDILYSYNPLSNSLLMEKALKNVVETMKVGATFYFVRACDCKLPKGFEQLNNTYDIYKYTKK